MICPVCESKTGVINSRSGPDEIVRKRICRTCGYVFYTAETEIDVNVGKQLIKAYSYQPKNQEQNINQYI